LASNEEVVFAVNLSWTRLASGIADAEFEKLGKAIDDVGDESSFSYSRAAADD